MEGRHVANWAMVRNQLLMDEGCLSLCSNTMLLIESIYTKLLTHPFLMSRRFIAEGNRRCKILISSAKLQVSPQQYEYEQGVPVWRSL